MFYKCVFISGLPSRSGRTRPGPGQDKAGAHQLQAPPAQDHEGPLPDQPEPRLAGAEDVVPEDRPRQESFAGRFFCDQKILRKRNQSKCGQFFVTRFFSVPQGWK